MFQHNPVEAIAQGPAQLKVVVYIKEGIQGGSAVRMRKAVPKAADVAFVAYDVVE